MDVDEKLVNPLELSLDELIHLNRIRNSALDIQEENKPSSLSHIVINNGRKPLTNGHTIEVSLDSVKGENKPFGSKSIHDRLGWKRKTNQYQKPIQGRYGGKTALQNQALRAIRNAQNFKSRPAQRKVINSNCKMLPPLTTTVLRRHNQANGNFMVARKNGAASVLSASTQRSRPTVFRHSTKKSLNPETQQIIRGFLNDNKPTKVQGQEGEIVVDYSFLERFKPKPDTTSLLTHIRFVMNG